MKIENKGVVITDVPGISSITVTAEDILIGGMRPGTWALPDLIELRDALTAAIEQAQQMAPRPPVGREPRVWRYPVDRSTPADVTEVRDKGGDVWTWNAHEGQWISDEGVAPRLTWEQLLDFAPLTEVVE